MQHLCRFIFNQVLKSVCVCVRLLETQLQSQSRKHQDELEALHTQIEVMKEDLEKKQEMLNHFSSLPPDALVEFSVQQEITRLTNENLVSHNHLRHLHDWRNCQLLKITLLSYGTLWMWN